MKSTTADALAEYFNEHVLYELLMLRYSGQRLLSEMPNDGRTQLLWNAMFTAFNVSARNIYDFLHGDKKYGQTGESRSTGPTAAVLSLVRRNPLKAPRACFTPNASTWAESGLK